MQDILTSPAVMVWVFTVLLLVAGLAYWIYSIFYRKRLDRALKEDAPAATPAPEPRRAGKLILWIGVAVCVVGLLHRAASLQARLENLELSMRNDMSNLSANLSVNLSNQINSNYQELIEQLRRENSLFLSSDYEIVNTDLAARTIFVRFTAVPKSAREDAELSLHFSDRSFPLFRQADGSYSDEFGIDFTELPPGDTAILCLTEDGVVRSEEVELRLENWREAFPRVEVNGDGRLFSESDGVVHLDQTVFACLFSPKSDIRELSLRALDSSGELLQEKDLMPELNQDDPTVETYDAWTDFSGDYPVGKEVRFLIRCENNAGLTHEIIFASLSPDGEFLNEWIERYLIQDGTLIWEACG